MGLGLGLAVAVGVDVGLGVSPGASVGVGVAVAAGTKTVGVGVEVAAGPWVGVGVASSPHAKIKSVPRIVRARVNNRRRFETNLTMFDIAALVPSLYVTAQAVTLRGYTKSRDFPVFNRQSVNLSIP